MVAAHRDRPRVEHVAQLVADQVDRDDGDQQRDAGIEADPVFARQQVLVAVGDQQAERGLGDRHAEAEEATASPRARWRAPPGPWRPRSAAAGSSAAGGGTRCASAAARGTPPPRYIRAAARPARCRARCARNRPTAPGPARSMTLPTPLPRKARIISATRIEGKRELQIDQPHDQRSRARPPT